MDIEKILPFVILGIYFLSLFGKKRKPRKEEPAGKTIRLKDIFQGIAKQLKEQAESAARGLEQPDLHWKSMKTDASEVKPPEVVWEEKIETDGSLPEFLRGEEEKVGIEAAAGIEAARTEQEGAEEVLSGKAKEQRSVGKAETENQIQKARSLVNLQQAVIWYEILSPPVALRDDHDRMSLE